MRREDGLLAGRGGNLHVVVVLVVDFIFFLFAFFSPFVVLYVGFFFFSFLCARVLAITPPAEGLMWRRNVFVLL